MTLGGTRLQRLTPSHVADLARLEKVCYPDHPWPPSSFLALIGQPRSCCLGLVRDGRVVGYALGSPYGGARTFHLYNLAIDPYERGRGWGRLLLDRLLAVARRLSMARCWLRVRESNDVARRLYADHGFVVRGRQPDYYPPSGHGIAFRPGEDAIIMEHLLTY